MRVVLLVGLVTGCTFADPDYSKVTFACDQQHACPAGQMCVGDSLVFPGTCQLAPIGDGVACGTAGMCANGQQCCWDDSNAPDVPPSTECLGPGVHCPGTATGCDEAGDCPTGTLCCASGPTNGCLSPSQCNIQLCPHPIAPGTPPSSQTKDLVHCPADHAYCCGRDETYMPLPPWGECDSSPCS